MAENVVGFDENSQGVRKKNVHSSFPKRTALAVINSNIISRPVSKKCTTNTLKNDQPACKDNIIRSYDLSPFDDKVLSEDVCKENLHFQLPEEAIQLVKPITLEKKESIQYRPSSSSEGKIRSTHLDELVWTSSYRNDIYHYLRERELKFQPRPNYMSKQPDISMYMRCVLVDWLVEVGEEYKLQAETLHLAVSYVDRFLSHMSVLRGKLQLVGVASMFIATKYEEIYPPQLKDFVYISDDTYTKKEILRMERIILEVLEFEIAIPTAYTFVHIFCSMNDAPDIVLYLAEYLCEISLLDSSPFLNFCPSKIAAAALAIANYVLKRKPWPPELEVVTGYQVCYLQSVIKLLFEKYCSMSGCHQHSIREKYMEPRFLSVATIKHPGKLDLTGDWCSL